jgi:para-aminobenzoate synthetase component II
MILLIDNYDSFVYNLYQYVAEMGMECLVKRNDKISLAEIDGLQPEAMIISPGPGRPEDAGISIDLIRYFAGKIPILGVCLGHQAISAAFGGNIIYATEIMHGKRSTIYHNNQGIFQGLHSPLKVTRYHSLLVERETLPLCFEITAETEDGLMMGIRHKDYAIEGVQFHPESIATEAGKQMMRQFLNFQPEVRV